MPYCFHCGVRTDAPSGVCSQCTHDMRLKDDDYRRAVMHKKRAAEKVALERREQRIGS